MKHLLLIFSIAMASAFSQSAVAEVCYGDERFDLDAPYTLTITKKLQDFQFGLLTEDLMAAAGLKVNSALSEIGIFVLGVDAHALRPKVDVSSNEKIDARVRRTLGSLMSKYRIKKSQYIIECTVSSHGNPRAGGMN